MNIDRYFKSEKKKMNNKSFNIMKSAYLSVAKDGSNVLYPPVTPSNDSFFDFSSNYERRSDGGISIRASDVGRCIFPLTPAFDYTSLAVGLMILILNGFTLYLFSTRKFLRRLAGNYILASLSLNDLLNGCYLLLSLLPKLYLHSDDLNYINDGIHLEDNGRYCSVAKQMKLLRMEIPTISRTLYRALMLSSVLHLVLLSTDRLVYVMKALTYDMLVTKKKIRNVILITWFSCVAAASVQLLWSLSNGPLNVSRKVFTFFTLRAFLRIACK